MLRLELFREITKSSKRFFSIFFIVALGVAFYAGVRSSQPDMERSVDSFYDDNSVLDLRVVSTWGFTDADVEEIAKLSGVEAVRGYRSADVVCHKGESTYNYTVIEHTIGINEFTITEGRLPYTPEECVIDAAIAESAAGISIGDTISVYSGSADEDIDDKLAYTTYKVVGIGVSPMFLTFDRGTCTTGDGDSDGCVLVTSEAFSMDYYTQVFIRAEDTKELDCFSEEYEQKIEELTEQIEMIEFAQCERRYQEVLTQTEEQLDAGRTRVAEATTQLNDALITLNDSEDEMDAAYETLNDGQQALDEGWAEYEAGKLELEEAQRQLAEGNTAYKEAEALIAEQESLLEQSKLEMAIAQGAYTAYQTQFTQYTAMVESLQTQLDDYQKKLAEEDLSDETRTTIEEVMTTLQTQLDSYKEKLDESSQRLAQTGQQLADAQAQIISGEAQIAAAKQEMTTQAEQMEYARTDIENGWLELSMAKQTLDASQTQLDTGWEEYNAGREELDRAWEEYYDAKAKADERIADAQDEIWEGEKTLSRLVMPDWTIYDRNSIQTFVEYKSDSERIGKIGEIFPVIFFLVAALVALTTMTRMVTEQRQQIGTMKALGFGNITIASKYLIYALSATLGGSIFGVVVGEKILPFTILKAYGILYATIPAYYFPYQPGHAGAATLAAVVCIGAATWFACYKELGTNPAQLMRPEAPKSGRKIIFERIPFLWKRISFTHKAAIRNLIRYKKRFMMTVFGIGGCMGILLTGYGLQDSILTIAKYQFTDLFHYDVSLSLDMTKDPDARAISEALPEEYPDVVEDSMALGMILADISSDELTKSAYMMVPQDTEKFAEYFLLRDRKTGETYEFPEEGVAISEKLAKLLGRSVGDEIIINYDDQVVTVEIACVIENYISHYVYLSSETYEELFGEEPKATTILFNMYNEEDETIRRQLAEELLADDRFMGIVYMIDSTESIDTMLANLDIVVTVLIIAAALLAFVVLFNLNNINITERRRELATLRVLGFYDMETAMYVYRENLILTVFGILFGALFGTWLHQVVIQTVEVDIMMFGREIFPSSYVYSALLTMLFAVIINGIMFFSLKKIDMVESLKSVE